MDEKFLDKSSEQVDLNDSSSGEGIRGKSQERLLKFKLSLGKNKKLEANLDKLDDFSLIDNDYVDKKDRVIIDKGINNINLKNTKDLVEVDSAEKRLEVKSDVNVKKDCLVKFEKDLKRDDFDNNINIKLSPKNIVVNEDKKVDSKLDNNSDLVIKKFEKKDEIVNDVNLEDFIKKNSVNNNEIVKSKKGIIDKENVDKKSDISSVVVKDVNKEVKNKCVGIIKRKDVSKLNDEEKSERIVELSQKILSEIDLKLERDIFELNEIIDKHNLLIEDCRSEQDLVRLELIRKEFEELYQKFIEFNKQIELLYENYDFEKIIDLNEFTDNQILVNDIIEFRDLLDNSDPAVELVEQYKLLDNFVMLHREIFLIEEKVKENAEKQDKKIEKVKDRDEHYSLLKDNIDNVSRVDSECRLIIDKQNEYVKALFNRINHISTERVVEYQIRGINTLLETTLLYMILMARNIQLQLSGRGMTARAMATRRMLANIRRQMNQDPVRVERIRYEAEDFESEISSHLDDIGIAINVIDGTIGDIKNYRREFEEKYKGKVPGYEEVLNRLLDVETMVFDSKKKALVAKAKLEESERINSDKLVRVRSLNENNH